MILLDAQCVVHILFRVMLLTSSETEANQIAWPITLHYVQRKCRVFQSPYKMFDFRYSLNVVIQHKVQIVRGQCMYSAFDSFIDILVCTQNNQHISRVYVNVLAHLYKETFEKLH